MSLLLLGVFFESDRPGNYQVDRSEILAVYGSDGCGQPDRNSLQNFRNFQPCQLSVCRYWIKYLFLVFFRLFMSIALLSMVFQLLL